MNRLKFKFIKNKNNLELNKNNKSCQTKNELISTKFVHFKLYSALDRFFSYLTICRVCLYLPLKYIRCLIRLTNTASRVYRNKSGKSLFFFHKTNN